MYGICAGKTQKGYVRCLVIVCWEWGVIFSKKEYKIIFDNIKYELYICGSDKKYCYEKKYSF